MTILYANIKKDFGDFLLDVEFEIGNETLALLGQSGCGKTMTLKCIAGIEKPDEGEIVLNNKILFNSKRKINLLPQKRKVGLLFQNYALFPNMTLEENIAIGVPKNMKNKEEIIKEKIQAFSLEGLEKNYPHQLSGGQQQRVALARMLVNQPKILMFDEPFSALDEHLRWQMEQEIIKILKENQNSALYVSHNKDEVYRISDRIAIIHNGKIEEINDKVNLFNKPKSYNSAILTGCENISRAKKVGENKIKALDWNLNFVFEGEMENIKYIGIHTHNIEISEDKNIENVFPLKLIDKIQNRYFETFVLIGSGGKSPIYLELPFEKASKYNIGENVLVKFKKEHLLPLK